MNKYFIILILTGSLFSCKSGEKGFPFFAKKTPNALILAGDDLLIQGITEKNKGNKRRALELFYSALKAPGATAPIHYEIAQLVYELDKNYELAQKHISKATSLDQNNKWYLFFQLKIAEENGKMDLVEKSYGQLLQLYPNSIDYRMEYADFFISQKKYLKAIGVYEKIEERIGVSEAVNKNKFIIYKGLSKDELAILELKKLIASYPNKSKYYLDLVDMYRITKNKDRVISTYELAMEKLVENTSVKDDYAHYLFYNGNKDKAFELHQQVIQDSDFSVEYKIDILRRYKKYGRKDSIVKNRGDLLLKSFTLVEKDDYSANKYLGELETRNRNFKQAIQHFNSALSIKKTSFSVWEQLILCYLEVEQWGAMGKTAKEASVYFPSQARLHYYAGKAALFQDKNEAAAEAFEQGLVLCTAPMQEVPYHVHLGDVYHVLKEHENSDKHYEKALTLDSLNPLALNNYAYNLAVRRKSLEKAKEMAELANILVPGIASYNDTYGYVLMLMGDYENALEWLLKARNNGGAEIAEINEHIADCYHKMGDHQKAKKYYQKAIQYGAKTDMINQKINALE